MKTQIKSILIPTDFSEASESALNVGIAIAKRQKADVTILHIVDRLAYLQPTEVFLPELQVTPDFSVMFAEKLKELSENLQKKTGLNVTYKIFVGQPADQICSYAFKQSTDLIVMGTHGISGVRQFFLGSDAYKVVKNAPCPVLTVPYKWDRKEFKKVLFPVRLVPGALDKYLFARPIIEKNKSELLILGLSDMQNIETTRELLMLVDALNEQLYYDNVKSQTTFYPAEEFPTNVINTVKEMKIDLIVLTANLDIDWKTFFIGPFVQQIISRSSVPVLSIKPSEDENRSISFKLHENWGKTLDFTDENESDQK